MTDILILTVLVLVFIALATIIVMLFRRDSRDKAEQWNEQMQRISEASNDRFEIISKEVLETATKHLKDDNSEQLSAVLTPLKERLESLQRMIHDVELRSTKSNSALLNRIDILAELNKTLGEDARNLTGALKGNSKVQGDWGETILVTLLENAGMVKGVNFISQATKDDKGNTLRDEEGNLQRPDIVVNIPGNRKLIIDSKVSLTAYVKLYESDNDEAKTKERKAHVDSVKKHVKELADKSYHKNVSHSLEHVVMFIPNEGAWITAMNEDPTLWNFAYNKKVIIAGPTHIMTLIQLISQMMREEAQDKNAEEIAKIGGYLYESFKTFVEKLEKLGTSIDSTKKIYDEVYKALDEGNSKSMRRRADKLKQLGAKTK